MKLFLYLIGGTGSRVLKPLIMQLAAGVCPQQGFKEGDELQIIPIVIDPHQTNADLIRTQTLLSWYKDIRKELYGNDTGVKNGFFGVKITSLAELDGKGAKDDFVFNLSDISDKYFSEYIDYNHMDSSNQALCQALFSTDQLGTKMDIGFVGSPNIGSVALNSFTESQEFERFTNVFSKDDRIFIVSSIFGGTGAAGYPLIVKNIRNARNTDASTRGDLVDAKIGALTVMPYFNVKSKDKDGNDSRIQYSDFIAKTKSALRYYKKNMTGTGGDRNSGNTVNACYYLADPIKSQPYDNDDGTYGQKNLAHFVEFVGALSIFDFLGLSDQALYTENGRADRPVYREFGLKRGLNEGKVTLDLMDFGDKTRQLIQDKMYAFHLSYMYYAFRLQNDLDKKQRYTDDTPKMPKDMLRTPFFNDKLANFYKDYIDWLGEMFANQPRCFFPFMVTNGIDYPYSPATTQLNNCINGIGHQKRALGEKSLDFSDVLNRFNKLSKENSGKYTENQQALKLMDLFYNGFRGMLHEFFVY